MIEERLRVARKLEEKILLRRPLDRMSAFVFAVADLILGNERLFVLAIPAGVLAEVDVVGESLLDAANQLEHADAMSRLGRANEIVVRDIELLPQIVIVRHDSIGQLDRQNAFFRRAALDFLPVLVGAGEEPDVVAHATAMSRDHVGGDVLVDVADVGKIVDVVNRGGDVKLLRHEGRRL